MHTLGFSMRSNTRDDFYVSLIAHMVGVDLAGTSLSLPLVTGK